jgi:DNA-binding MarR family transcriptional regulator
MTPGDPLIEQARRVLRLIPRLHRWATATLQANRLCQDLSLRQLGMLFLVREGMSSPGDLARRLRVSPAVITGVLDRLERRGYLRRAESPDDRRRLCVALTESGLAISHTVDRVLVEGLAGQLANAPAPALEGLGSALGLLELTIGALEARAGAPDDLLPGLNDPDWQDDAAGGREPRRTRGGQARGGGQAQRARASNQHRDGRGRDRK